MLGRVQGGQGQGTAQRFYEGGIEYGYGTYGSLNVLFPSPEFKCVVGRYCSIAPGVTVLMKANHHVEWITTYPFSAPPIRFNWPTADPHKETTCGKGHVIVGNDVWIGRNATILSGVTIGDGAVIGCDSVVTKDVPPYAIVAGNPASVRKYRFDEETVKVLLRLKWWDWSKDKMDGAVNFLQSSDVAEFIRKYGAG
jgi:acetyltransferase-like isoleucine patch superfamily enzyme